MDTTTNDRTTVNLVVALLGTIAIVALGGVILLAATHSESAQTTTALVGITTGAVGAIAGLLANTRSTDVAGLGQLADAQHQQQMDAMASGVRMGVASRVPPLPAAPVPPENLDDDHSDDDLAG